MQQRQCVILKGDAKWCRESAKHLLTDFEQDTLLYISNTLEQDVLSLVQKQAKQQLGQEFAAVVFDACDELTPDNFGIAVGMVKAGGTFILCLPDTLPTSLFLQRFNHVINQFVQTHETFYSIEQGDDLVVLPIINQSFQQRSDYQTQDQQLAVEAILKVVHGHRRRPLVLSADRGRGKSASLGIAAAQLVLEGKKTILVTAPSLTIADTVFKHAASLLPDCVVSKGLIRHQYAEIRFIAPDELINSELKADLVLVDEAAANPNINVRTIISTIFTAGICYNITGL